MFSDEQLERRRETLGSSEIAAIVGEDEHHSALDVWLSKRGEVNPATEQTELGQVLEEPIAQLAAKRLGFVSMERGETVTHGLIPWMTATPDRIVTPAGIAEARRVLEVKLVGHRMMGKWGDESEGTAGVRYPVQLQAQWQLACVDMEHAHVAALIGGRDLRCYPVPRDRELAADLMTIAATWWRRHIIEGIAPDPDGTDRYSRYLRQKFSERRMALRKATHEEDYLMFQWREAQHDLAKAKKKAAIARQEVEAVIGADLGLEGAYGRAKWVDVAEHEVRAQVREANRYLKGVWR